VKLAATLAAVLVATGCASQAAERRPARGALTEDELGWVRAYVSWRTDFDRITFRGSRARARSVMAHCSQSLAREVSSAPSRRLRPAERLARRACAEWERHVRLFQRFYDRHEFRVGPAMAAAESHASDASSRAFTRLSALLWESRPLPRIARASRASRLQPRYAAVANRLTSRALEVRCWNVAGWERVLSEAAAFDDLGSIDVDGFANFYTGRINLSPDVCASLDALTYGDERPRRGGRLDDLAYAVFVLGHETDHIAGVDNEAVATCDGMQRVDEVARHLGADERYARRLALAYWARVYPNEPTRYQSIRCGPDRPLDRSPGDGVWP
jgi:hypothetical protein